METPELYIPPCCIHKQLPDLIRQGGAYSVFYSQGDWGLPKLTYAVESMVSSQGQSVTTILVIPDATLTTARYIEKELNMGWSRAIILVTATDQTELLRQNISAEHLPHLTYCPGRKEAETSNLWIRHTATSHLLITGSIHPEDTAPRHVCAYTAHFVESKAKRAQSNAATVVPVGHAQSEPEGFPEGQTTLPQRLKQAFAPWRSMIRLHATLRGTDPLLDLWLKR